MITAEDQNRIAEAIHEAERRTAGEIVVVVARQANGYRGVPLFGALLIGLALPWPLIALTGLGASRIFLIQLLATLLLSLVFSWSRIHLFLVPGTIKRTRAHEAALREFASHGLSRTKGRTGILIYVAAAEHYVEIVADIGISDRAGPHVWQEIVAEMIASIRAERAGDGLVQAVKRAGAILAEHAPRTTADTDELPNKVIML